VIQYSELMVSTGSWDWDRVSDAFWSNPSEDVYHLLHRWTGQTRSSILDLGCGLGRHSLLFALYGFDVTALDASESGLRRLEAAAARLGLSVHTVHADLTKLPFDAGSFDFVLAYHSIYHVDSEGMAAAMNELHRILKPASEVYLTLNSKTNPTYADPGNLVVDDHVRLKREEDGGSLPHYYCDLGDVRTLLSRFTIIKLRHIEDVYDDRSSWHYFVLAGRG
jgi:SAM-dependent methyltransferase